MDAFSSYLLSPTKRNRSAPPSGKATDKKKKEKRSKSSSGEQYDTADEEETRSPLSPKMAGTEDEKEDDGQVTFRNVGATASFDASKKVPKSAGATDGANLATTRHMRRGCLLRLTAIEKQVNGTTAAALDNPRRATGVQRLRVEANKVWYDFGKWTDKALELAENETDADKIMDEATEWYTNTLERFSDLESELEHSEELVRQKHAPDSPPKSAAAAANASMTLAPAAPVIINRQTHSSLKPLQLSQFSGQIVQYTEWSQAFTADVGNNASLTPIQKWGYLKAAVTEEVREENFNGLDHAQDNFLVAWERLEKRYGQPDVLISAHMSGLWTLPALPDGAGAKDLRKTHNEISNHLMGLEKAGAPISDQLGITIVESKMNSRLAKTWDPIVIDKKDRKEAVTVKDFLRHLHLAVLAAEREENRRNVKSTTSAGAYERGAGSASALVAQPTPQQGWTKSGRGGRGGRWGRGGYNQSQNQPRQQPQYQDRYGAGGQEPMRGRNSRERGRRGRGGAQGSSAEPRQLTYAGSCVVCSQHHMLRNCPTFQKMDVDRRWTVVSQNKGCFACLRMDGHAARQCPQAVGCAICTGRHNTLLHKQDRPTTSQRANVAQTDGQMVQSGQHAIEDFSRGDKRPGERWMLGHGQMGHPFAATLGDTQNQQ